MSASTEFIVLLEKIEQVVGKNKGRIIVNLAISELEKIASREGVILLDKRELELNTNLIALIANNQFGENSPNNNEASLQQFPMALAIGVIIMIVLLVF